MGSVAQRYEKSVFECFSSSRLSIMCHVLITK